MIQRSQRLILNVKQPIIYCCKLIFYRNEITVIQEEILIAVENSHNFAQSALKDFSCSENNFGLLLRERMAISKFHRLC